jgi:hypothetical protein
VPLLENYCDQSGEDLNKYLEKFEDYCGQNFRGRKHFWIGELERHLTGKTLEGFKILRQFNDNYCEVKDKLLSWYKDERDIRKERAKQKFEQARPKTNESTYLFSSRLENLFKLAYPRKLTDNNKKLIHKFKAVIDKPMRDIINAQIMSANIEDRKLKWRTVQKCSRFYDLEKKIQKEKEESSEAENEIIINLTSDQNRNERNEVDGNRNNAVNGHKYQFERPPYQFPPKLFAPVRPSNNFRERPAFPPIARFNAPPPFQASNTCGTCGKFGHSTQQCRVRLRACFGCGGLDHFIRDCPVRNMYYEGSREQELYTNRDNHYNLYNGSQSSEHGGDARNSVVRRGDGQHMNKGETSREDETAGVMKSNLN